MTIELKKRFSYNNKNGLQWVYWGPRCSNCKVFISNEIALQVQKLMGSIDFIECKRCGTKL